MSVSFDTVTAELLIFVSVSWRYSTHCREQAWSWQVCKLKYKVTFYLLNSLKNTYTDQQMWANLETCHSAQSTVSIYFRQIYVYLWALWSILSLSGMHHMCMTWKHLFSVNVSKPSNLNILVINEHIKCYLSSASLRL